MVKNLPTNAGDRRGFDPWIGKIPWSRKWQSTPIFLPGKFHGQRSLEVYSLWGCKESDTTEGLSVHTSHTKPHGQPLHSPRAGHRSRFVGPWDRFKEVVRRRRREGAGH